MKLTDILMTVFIPIFTLFSNLSTAQTTPNGTFDMSSPYPYFDAESQTWKTHNPGQKLPSVPYLDGNGNWIYPNTVPETKTISSKPPTSPKRSGPTSNDQRQFGESSTTINIRDLETTVKVNVYELNLGILPLMYHTDITIGECSDAGVAGKPWSFWPERGNFLDDNGTVAPGVPNGARFTGRTIVRRVNREIARRVFWDVKNRWEPKRYAAIKGSNCNHFVNDMLLSMGVQGLDKEYLIHSGFRVPLAEVQQALQDAGGQIAKGSKNVAGQLSNGSKNVQSVISGKKKIF